MIRCLSLLGIVVATVAFEASLVRAGDWPSFRGAQGTGLADEPDLPSEWSNTKNVLWKVALPRPANGSPIVSNGCVFVTSAEDPDGRQRSLYCFDRQDGAVRWKRTVQFEKTMPTHKDNPYCGSTPAANGHLVVVWHASAGLYCYDFAGNEQWSRDLGEFEHMWGYGTSPVIHEDRVIMHCSPGKRNFTTAIELQTGRTLWEREEPHQGDGNTREDGKYMGSWCTPIVTSVAGRDQIICTMPTRVVAYDPHDGQLIWSCEGIRGERGDLAYSSPIIAEELCVVMGGFRGPAIGVRLGDEGDITLKSRVWRREQNPQNIGSGVYLQGFIYRPNAGPGTLECLDPKTGDVLWTERAAGGNYWGSIVCGGEHCFVTNQDGVTIVFRPSPEGCQIVAENDLKEPSNSTPAISDGQIFIRTFDHLYCIAD